MTVTTDGNIGPVADALAEALGAHRVIICPAFPSVGRSVYQGHLFVNDNLLNESGMENHPLNTNDRSRSTEMHGCAVTFFVGHVCSKSVFEGSVAILKALETQHSFGHRHIVIDAIRDADLCEIGKAASNLSLITGGSGVAQALPANFGCEVGAVVWQGQAGRGIALSGSCSNITREQVLFSF